MDDMLIGGSSAVFKILFMADTASGEITKFSNNSWYVSQASIFFPLGGVGDQVTNQRLILSLIGREATLAWWSKPRSPKRQGL